MIIQTDVFMMRAADSAKMLPYWDLTDTLEAGGNAMRVAGEKYLPKFIDETNERYQFRLRNTKFTNIYRDIVEALSNKAFEEPIGFKDDSKPSQEIEKFTWNVDGAGTDITSFAAEVMFAGINSAIDWIFVDYPTVGPEVVTIAQVKAAGVRPFWTRVLGRNVLEAKAQVISGNERLVYIRIFEPGSPDHVRVFRREGDLVTWALFRRMSVPHKITAEERYWLNSAPSEDTETYFIIADEGVLSIPEIPLVPFYTGRRHGRTFCFSPAMRDAAELQVELYQEESALKFTCTMAAFPMLAANGIRPQLGPDGKPLPLNVSPSTILYAPPDGAGNVGSWAYVQPDAAVLKFLQEKADKTIQNLRELGRQPLTAQSGNLTVITTAVAAGKAKSAVAAWAGALGNALDNALRLTNMFLGKKDGEEPSVSVYDDFDNFDASGNDLAELGKARERRDISQRTYWNELQRRRVLGADFDADTEIETLLNELPGEEFEEAA